MPEVAIPSVTQTQLYEQPVKDGISGFLNRVLPQVVEGVQDYQKDSANRNIALGMNDVINGVEREVTFLDRANYEQGREIQKVTSTRARDQTEYIKQAESIIYGNGTEADADALREEFLRKQVDSIYYSDLSSQHKEMLLEAGIDEAAAYAKVTSGVLKKQKEIQSQASARTRIQGVYQLVRGVGGELNGNILSTVLDAQWKQSYTAHFELGTAPDEVAKLAAQEVAASIQYATSMYDPRSPEANNFANALQGALQVIDSQGRMPFEIRMDLQNQLNTMRASNQQYNNTMLQNQGLQLELDSQGGDPDAVITNAKAYLLEVERLETEGIITPEDAFQRKQFAAGLVMKSNEAALQGMYTGDSIINNGISYQQFYAAGEGGEPEYSDLIFQSFVKNNMNNDQAIGRAALDRAMAGNAQGEYLPTLAKKGVQFLSQQFVGFMYMSPKDAENNENYQNAVVAWDTFKQVYNDARKVNGSLATAMLGGLPEDSVSIIQGMAESNANLHSAQAAMNDPISTNQRRALVNKAIDNISTDVLNNKWFGNSMGGKVWGWGMNSEVGSSFENIVKNTYRSSIATLSTGATDDNPERLLDRAVGKLHVQGKYSDTLFSEQSIGYYGNIKHNGAIIPRDIISKEADSIREEVAKQAGTNPKNVLIYSPMPSTVVVQAYDKDGKLKLNIGGSGYDGRVFTQQEFTKRLKDRMDTETSKYGKQIIRDVSFGDIWNYGDNIKRIQQQDRERAAQREQVQGKSKQAVAYNPKAYVAQGIAGTTPVKLNASHAVPFGGDIQLAKMWNNHVNNHEGWLTDYKVVTGEGGHTTSKTVGHGLNWTGNPKWRAKMDAAVGNPQKIMDVTGDFAAASGSLQNAAKRVGIPVATTGSMYDTRFAETQMLLADYRWASGNTKSIEHILTQPNYTAALAAMRNSKEYKMKDTTQATEAHRRNVWRRNALRNFYNAKGKL